MQSLSDSKAIRVVDGICEFDELSVKGIVVPDRLVVFNKPPHYRCKGVSLSHAKVTIGVLLLYPDVVVFVV